MTFKEVAGATELKSYDLCDIAPKAADGTDWATSGGSACNGAVSIRCLKDNDGHYDTEYKYYSTSNYNGPGWYEGAKNSTKLPINRGDVTFSKGQGLIVYCSKSAGASLQVSGEVEFNDMSFAIPYKYSFCGNNTPVEIDLVDVVTTQTDGTEWATSGGSACNGAVSVRLLKDNDGHYDTEYKYYSTSNYNGPGWYEGAKNATKQPITRDTMKIPSGEGIIVYCSKSAGAKLVMPKPIK